MAKNTDRFKELIRHEVDSMFEKARLDNLEMIEYHKRVIASPDSTSEEKEISSVCLRGRLDSTEGSKHRLLNNLNIDKESK